MAGGIVILNGKPIPGNIVIPSVQEILGFTDEQMHALMPIADDYREQNRLIDASVRSLVWQARLHGIAEEEVPAEVTQQLKDAENRRREMVLDHMRQLKAALGDAAFRALDERARSIGTDSSVFPVVIRN
jgi:hypothetical protein